MNKPIESKNVKNIDLQDINEDGKSNEPVIDKNMDLVKNIEINLSVAIGEASISLGDLYDHKVGSLVKLNKNTNEPVDLIYEDKVIAKGELVAVDDNFGVRIEEVFLQK